MRKDNDLSTLVPVTPDPGKYQWVKCTITGTDDKQQDLTHTAAVPHLMPGTTIFVHGVNSDGEWYFDASGEFAKGLNRRLGREDLKQLVKDQAGDKDKVTAHRYLKAAHGQRVPSPIIPFWWGYKADMAGRKLIKGSDKDAGHTPAYTDNYGNPLRTDSAWGGGPFQNGGAALTSFWLPTGFRKQVLNGVIDVNALNPVLGRELCDCPPRLYYAHAARRLAYLIKDIRRNLPNEPINIVSHSQGTIVALCSLFFLDGERGPDTVILNSSPYRFDTQITDFVSAADGWGSVQSKEARIATFAKAASILADAARNWPAPPAPKAECTVDHKPRHAYDDALYAHKPADAPQWQAEIGGKVEDPKGPRGQEGTPWWRNPKFARGDTRGKLMVNFNPGDRVIGVSAVAGMGWRGIPSGYLGQVGGNVQQRMFARGTNDGHNPAVGSKTGYAQHYFYKQIKQVSASGETQGHADEEEWRYLDGSAPNRRWKLPSEKILHVMPVLGSLPLSKNDTEAVIINAPEVPYPVTLPDKFDGGYVMYDGKEGNAPDGASVEASAEQQEDFRDDVTYQERQTVMDHDEKGMPTQVRYETWEEVEKRRANKVGRVPVSPTNHAAILRYADKGGASPVADVLSYDLTVGLGYAWHDEAYWNYLLDLADWKKSDPYYESGQLPDSDKAMPSGIVTDGAPADTPPAAHPRRELASSEKGRH